MESQSRKLSVYELFRLKWLVGTLMALVSVSSLLNLDSHNWVPAIVSLVAMGGCVLFPTIYSKAPPGLWKIFALSIIPLVSIDVLAKETVPALLNLNTWLILYRALNHTKRREEMQLALLCLFLLVMVGATIGKYAKVITKGKSLFLNQNMWRLSVINEQTNSQKFAIYGLQKVIEELELILNVLDGKLNRDILRRRIKILKQE